MNIVKHCNTRSVFFIINLRKIKVMKHYILLPTAEKVLPPGYYKTNSVGTEYSIINTASN